MKPWSRSKVVLVTSALLWACSGDPTDSFRGSVAEVTARPTSLFIERGQTKQVVVSAVDEQGNPLLDDISVSGGAGLTIVEDTTYLQTTTNPQPVKTEKAFNVTANDLTSTSFTVSAGGKSVDVAVKATPPAAEVPVVTVASSGPNASDPAVLTVPAPYVFPSDADVFWLSGADTLRGIITDLGADSRSVTVLPPPGVTGSANVSVAVEFIPDVHIADTTNVPLTINAAVPANPATNSPATAPEVVISDDGHGGFFDGGSWGAATCGGNSGAPCQLYKLVLPADATFHVFATADNTTDIGVYFLTADGTADTDQACDEQQNDGTPESCDITLPAGTYLIGMVSFGPFYGPPPDPNPTWISLAITPAE
jgi:hypothetical protein